MVCTYCNQQLAYMLSLVLIYLQLGHLYDRDETDLCACGRPQMMINFWNKNKLQ